MKKLLLILSAVCAMTACSKGDDNNGTTKGDYKIIVSTKVNIVAEDPTGKNTVVCEIPYNIKRGNDLITESATAEVTGGVAWLTIRNVTPGLVVLTAEENPDAKERIASLKLSFGGCEEYVRIIQAKRFINEEMFDITVSDISSDAATITAMPKVHGDDTYYFDYVAKSTYDEYGREAIISAYVDGLKRMIESNQQLGLQISLLDVLSRYPSTKTTKSATSLDDDTAYYAFAFDLDVNAKYSGNISLKEFHTAKATPSSNVIKIEIKQTGIEVTTTNSDPYVFHIIDKKTWNTASDAEEAARGFVSAHKQYVLDPLTNYIKSGNATFVDLSEFDITEGGEYVAYAFGYNKGITTAVTFVEFVIE